MKISATTRGLQYLANDALAGALHRYRQLRVTWMSFCALSMVLILPAMVLVAQMTVPTTSLMSVETARPKTTPPIAVAMNTPNATGSGLLIPSALSSPGGAPWDDSVATATATAFEDESVHIDSWEVREIEPGENSPILYFDGRPIRPIKTVTMTVTAYSPDARSCAPFDDGITASGYSVWTNGMKLIAADKRFKFGTLLSVPGYNGNKPTPVLDRGAAIKGNRLDLLFPTHEIARQWGRRKLTVTIWDYVDETEQG